jgi:diacylglycerol kinase (ATP)
MHLLNKVSNTLIIVNPEANERRTLSAWKKIKHSFEKYNIPYNVEFTKSRDDAVNLVSKDKYHKNILSLSGDGGMNAVAEGAMKNEQEKNLGMFAGGTANDFARIYNPYRDTSKLSSILANEQTRKIDVGEVNGKFFLAHASVGFDAETLNERNKRHFLKRKLAYYSAVFRALSKYTSKDMTIKTSEEEITKTTFMAVISNIPYYADGMEIAPRAKSDDELLDLFLIEGKSSLSLLLRNLSLIHSGKHLDSSEVYHRQIKNLEILSPEQVFLQIDGDLVGKSDYFKFEVADRKLNILCDIKFLDSLTHY